MTTLYLVRHGETVDNARQIMQGQTQGELNENGIRQAEQVRDEWADRPLDAIVASDLKRSVDTASIIAAPHHLKGPDDIETLENLLSRASEFIAYIRDTYPGKKVLAVGHGIINKAIQAVYYKQPMSEVQRMMNAEVRVLEL